MIMLGMVNAILISKEIDVPILFWRWVMVKFCCTSDTEGTKHSVIEWAKLQE
jgi:hypothetical protein